MLVNALKDVQAIIQLDTCVIKDLCDCPEIEWLDDFYKMKADGYCFTMSFVAYSELKSQALKINCEDYSRGMSRLASLLHPDLPVFPECEKLFKFITAKNKTNHLIEIKSDSISYWHDLTRRKLTDYPSETHADDIHLNDDPEIADLDRIIRESENDYKEIEHFIGDFEQVMSLIDNEESYIDNLTFLELEKIDWKEQFNQEMSPQEIKEIQENAINKLPQPIEEPSLLYRLDLLLNITLDLRILYKRRKYIPDSKKSKNDGVDSLFFYTIMTPCIVCTSDKKLLLKVERVNRTQSQWFFNPKKLSELWKNKIPIIPSFDFYS